MFQSSKPSGGQPPSIGGMLNRGPGGVLPARGSQQQMDIVSALVNSGMQSAGQSGSPLLAFLAPLAGGAVLNRTTSLYEDAQKSRNNAAMADLIDMMNPRGSVSNAPPVMQTKPGSPFFRGPNPDAGDPRRGTFATGGTQAAAPEERELLARTLQAEAGGEGLEGMIAAGAVIKNRVKVGGYGDGLEGVIMKPGQISAWNSVTGYAGGEGGLDMANMRPSDEAYQAADMLLSGNYVDPTGGATHYYNPSVADPAWGTRNGGDWLRIGNHIFGKADAGRSGGPATVTNATAEQLETLMGIATNQRLDPYYRDMATQLIGQAMQPAPKPPTRMEQIELAQAEVDLANSMRGDGQWRPATPEEAAQYGATAGQFDPTGRFFPVRPNRSSNSTTGEAGLLRQRNEATTILAGAIEAQTLLGSTAEEARAAVAANPIYRAQLEILGVTPEEFASGEIPAEATPTGAPPPPPGFTEDF